MRSIIHRDMRYVFSVVVFFLILQIQEISSEQNFGTVNNSARLTANGYFQFYSKHYLQVSVLRSVFVYDSTVCSSECVRQPSCFSFNVAVNPDETTKRRLCELLATTQYYAQEAFKPHLSFHHFSTIHLSPTRSCLDHLKRGAFKNGLYTIQDQPQGDHENRIVYCDLASEPGRAWTLVMSWSLKNKLLRQFNTDVFATNAPLNDANPNWNSYRLPLSVMTSLKTQSPLWRATCSFPLIVSNDTLYRDYLRCNFHDFDIFSFQGYGVCNKVDYVNIRGHVGVSTEAQIWQRQGMGFHIDSTSTGCAFKPNAGATSSENNFGYYSEGTNNPKFRCTASIDQTTNWWFGGASG